MFSGGCTANKLAVPQKSNRGTGSIGCGTRLRSHFMQQKIQCQVFRTRTGTMLA
jgi:hypothetical protein